MKEKIYTIPVNDAFSSDCECPICSMYKALEDDAVSYTMGPSYMEDDIRAMTDKKGFCQKHLKKVYDCENRLGFALVMKTHLDKVINDIENMKRVRDDVEWFINKFDHKYIDEPWKNAKDSLVRAMIKDGSYIADEPGKKNIR